MLELNFIALKGSLGGNLIKNYYCILRKDIFLFFFMYWRYLEGLVDARGASSH